MDYGIIIAIDPGDKHTGIAYTRTKLLGTDQIDLKDNNRTQYINEILDWLKYVFEPSWPGEAPILVIVEAFTLYPFKAQAQSFSEMETSQLIGAIKNICAQYPNVTCIEQNAAKAKIWSNERLTRLGFFVKTNHIEVVEEITPHGITKTAPIKHHARDAFRHLIYWLNKNKFDNMITLDKVFWSTPHNK